MDTIAPTRERLRHASSYDKPETSQQTARVAYRVRSRIETMRDRGELTVPQWRAGEKLEKHYQGSLGIRVSDSASGAVDNEAEFASVYHGQQVANAAKALLPLEFRALVATVEERETPEDLGRAWRGYSTRPQAHAAGMCLIILGLERLAVHWRLKEP